MVVGFGILGLRGIEGDGITSLLGILFCLGRIDVAWDRMGRVDIGTLRVEIGTFIGMARRGLGSPSEKMKGYGIAVYFMLVLHT